MYSLIYENYKFLIIIGYILLILFLLVLMRYLLVYFFKKIKAIIIKIILNIIKTIKSNNKINLFIKSHPKIFLFLKNRFSKDSFFGLPLTILSLLILYIITEYIGLTDAVLNGRLITQIDIRLSEFFYYFKDIRLINLFLFISYFGYTTIVILITSLLSISLLLKGKIKEILSLLFSISFTSIIVTLSKILIERPRPEYAVYVENGYGFPSFHAAISVVLYGFIIWLIFRKTKKNSNKINVLFAGVFISFIIGLSRLYLNEHYLSDVISGWFLGGLGLTFGITFFSYLKHKSLFKEKIYFKGNTKLVNYILLIIFILFSIYNYKNYYESIIFKKNIVESYTQITDIIDILNNKPHLKYTETITGRETEPINFIFKAKSEDALINVFQKVGWEQADKIGRTALKKIGNAMIEKTPYDTAPITPLYWNKNIQILGFQELTKAQNIDYRHHIRIWKTNYKIGDNFIYVGCGIYDDGIKWGITHKISPDLDKEREYIFSSLKEYISDYKLVNLKVREKGKNFSGDNFFTDGNAYLINIKSS